MGGGAGLIENYTEMNVTILTIPNEVGVVYLYSSILDSRILSTLEYRRLSNKDKLKYLELQSK